MLSSLGTIFDKAFIVGFMLPTILFFTALSSAVPGFDLFGVRLSALTQENAPNVAYAILVIWIMSLLLSIANMRLYRVFEGYYWPSPMAEAGKKIQLDRFQALVQEYEKLSKVPAEPQLAPCSDYRKAQSVLRKLRSSYPYAEHDLLPTRLGNAIRSFERYPNRVHGADGVALWMRVLSVAPDRAVALIDETKSRCDFFLNVCVYSIVFAVAMIFMSMAMLYNLSYGECAAADCRSEIILTGVTRIFLALTAGAMAVTSYLEAVSMAQSWGNAVRSLYDVSLCTLLEKIGIDGSASDAIKRQALRDLAMQAVYAEPERHW